MIDFKAIGVLKPYKFILEPETGAILVSVRQPVEIINGQLQGTEIVWLDEGFKIWTGKTRKAKRLATRFKLRIRLITGEAELWVPANLADTVLPFFGARVRRELSAAEKVARLARLQGPNLAIAPQKNGGSGGQPLENDHLGT